MSSENKKDNGAAKDFDDLLDEASAELEKATLKSDEPKTDVQVGEADNTDFMDDDFFIQQAKLLSERMNTVFSGNNNANPEDLPPLGEDQLAMGFKKMAEAAALALQGGPSANTDEAEQFSSSISGALKDLQQGVQNIQAPISEDDVAKMFGNLSADDKDGGANPFLPFMEGMMQSLLSAEILLPSINELLEKYPSYLEENASTISTEDKERYQKQFELFKVIKTELEAETENDAADVKSKRFKVVLENMQKLHEYGQPPVELVGEQGSPFDNAPMGGANTGCPMM